MIWHRRLLGVTLLLESHEIVSLGGATGEVFLPWPADKIQQQGMLDVQERGLVGLTTENDKRGLVHRAPLQQGLPQDDDLDLLIGGYDAADSGGQWCNGGSGRRW